MAAEITRLGVEVAEVRGQVQALADDLRAQEEQATLDKLAAEQAYDEASAELSKTRSEARQLDQDLATTRISLRDSRLSVDELSDQLEASQTETTRLSATVRHASTCFCSNRYEG